MDKDFEYEEFVDFINSMKSYISTDQYFAEFSQQTKDPRVLAIENSHDKLEVDVASRPCYSSVENLLSAIRET